LASGQQLGVKPLILVPAAGFGRRVGSPEAKELFLRDDGTLLIDLAIQTGTQRGWPVHVITRPEKKTLIRYLEQFSNVTVQLIGATFDWPETLLLSEPHWHPWNLVFLPDMDFKPQSIVDDLQFMMSLEKADVITANHVVTDPQKWGLLWPEKDWGLTVGEKVPVNTSEPRWAWGLYAFKKHVGKELLTAQLESCRDHRLRHLQLRAASLQLHEFVDLTRTDSSREEYIAPIRDGDFLGEV
jgi:hypothetical protein